MKWWHRNINSPSKAGVKKKKNSPELIMQKNGRLYLTWRLRFRYPLALSVILKSYAINVCVGMNNIDSEVRLVRRDTRLTIRVKVWRRGSFARNLNGWDDPMHGSARAESGARADWQACTTRAFLLQIRTSCTVFKRLSCFPWQAWLIRLRLTRG